METKPSLRIELGKVLQSTPADRARAIIDSPLTRQILERLSPQETYMIIKDSWGTDSQILLQYVPPETISHIIDMDCWEKDTLSVNALLDWLWEIYNSSVDSLQDALDALDLDIVILLFQSYIEVVQVVPTDERIPDLLDAGFESLDDNYYFLFKEEDEKTPLLKDMLSLIFTHHQDTYYAIMEGVIWEMKSYIEENIYEKRSLRLMELGFPPPDEAVGIYRRVQSHKLLNEGLSREKIPLMDKEQGLLPALYLDHLSQNTGLIVSSLNEASKETRERFVVEMIYLANKVVMADYRPLNEVEELKNSIDKASSLSSLGLAVAMKTRGASAREIIETMNAETLFALGYNVILDQQIRLRQIMRTIDINLIPEELSAHAEGLLKKRPLYKDREFSSIEQLDEVTHTVDMIEALAAIAERLNWKGRTESFRGTNTGSAFDLETVILTVLAVNFHDRSTDFRPLSIRELTEFIAAVTSSSASGKRSAIPEFRRNLVEFLGSLAPGLQEKTIEDTAGILLRRFEDEFSGIGRLEELDPRFITCLVVKV